jgi:hypothetical protein
VDILILDDFGGVCDGRKEEVMIGHTLLCLIMINYCYVEEWYADFTLGASPICDFLSPIGEQQKLLKEGEGNSPLQ